MQEEARSRRSPLGCTVHLQSRGALEVAELVAVEADGLRVRAPRLPPEGTRLRLRLELPDGRPPILASGVIASDGAFAAWWKTARIAPIDLDETDRVRIDALERPPEVDEADVEVIAASADAGLAYRVTYRSLNAFLREYRSNLERGGLFLATEERLERLSPVAVELALPGESAVLALRGTVVYRVEADPDLGKPAGLGVHFRHGDGADLEPIHALARRLDGTRDP